MPRIISVLLTLLCICTHMSASEKADTSAVKMPTCSVDGKVLYYAGNRGIQDAKIRMVDKHGKEYVTGTDMSGLFQFKSLPVGDYELTASHMGYDSFTSKYSLTEGRCVIYIRLKPSEDAIDGATVIAEAALLRQIADTTIYNAAALRADAWARAEELLKQIPGASVNGGQITIHGEPVARTFVNGTLVFGDNPVTAFKQLMASDVTHIKVYDETSVEDKLAGKKNSRKERILNVITKDKISMAVIGRLEAAGGLDQKRTIDGNIQPRYGLSGNIHLHSEMLQIQIDGGSNNVNAQPNLFSPERNRQLSSYSENSGIAVLVSKYWGDRIIGNNITASYSFSHAYDRTEGRSATDYIATEASPAILFRDTTRNRSINKAHHLGLDLYCAKTKIGTINARVVASLSNNSSINITGRSEALENSLAIYSENSTNKADLSRFGTTIRWNNKFGNLRPHASIDLSYHNSRNSNYLIDTLGTSAYPKRALHGKGRGGNIYGAFTAGTEAFLINTDKQTITLDAAYVFEFANNDDNKLTYNYFGFAEPVVDITNTFDYRWRTQVHSLNVALLRDTRLTNLAVHVRPLLKTAFNKEMLPTGYENARTYFAICPSASFAYKKRLKAAFTTDTSVPTMEQTRPKINDVIQSRLSAGNPDLKQSYISKLSLSYSTKPDAHKPLLESSLQASVTANPIVTRMRFMTEDTILEQYDGYVAKAGSILSTYSNAPAMATVSLKTQVSGQTNTRMPWYATVSYTYRHLPQYASDELIFLNEHTPALQGRYSYRTPFGLTAKINGTVMYVNSRNSEGTLVNEAVGGRGGVSADWLFMKKFQVQCSYDVSVYHMLNRKMTNVTQEMQAFLKIELLRRCLYMTISGHDLLNTADSYSVTSSADRIVQTWTPAYGRYFLLGFIWEFRKNR
ncbi:MAG: hypothetical protein E7116_02245 [Bacteroidales bacterium]|nr:hypothetical protein [Bacteroidales bacterium]